MAGEDRYKHPSNKKHVGGGSDGKAVEPAKKEADKKPLPVTIVPSSAATTKVSGRVFRDRVLGEFLEV